MHSVPLSNRESISNFIRNAETLLAEAKYLASSVLKRARIASLAVRMLTLQGGGAWSSLSALEASASEC